MILKQLNIHTQKNEVGPFSYSIHKNELQVDCLRAKTINLFEENFGVNLCDLELSKGILDTIPKAKVTEGKWINLTS